MTFRRTLLSALVLVLLAVLPCAQAQQLPSFSDNAAPQAGAQTGATLTTDTMRVTIDGEEKLLTLSKCEKSNYNALILTYSCLNPLGAKEWDITFYFTLGDAPGTVYQTETMSGLGMTINSDSIFSALSYTKSLIYGAISSNSSYKLTIDSRSADWRTYTGSFSATLKTAPDLFNSSQKSISLTDGYFCCTYTGT